MTLRKPWLLLALVFVSGHFMAVEGQLDPVKRRLVQVGYNQYLEETGPIAAYGFFYYNNPNYYATNVVLRIAVAPIYADGELGYMGFFGPNTDFAIGLAGGGFADTYSEIRRGEYEENESFTGHSGEFTTSVYHRFNPARTIPLWGVARVGMHESLYEEDSETDPLFMLPRNRNSSFYRTGLRYGGQAPNMTSPLAMELSIWHEGWFRSESGTYGFGGDRAVNANSHLFWGRGLLKYTFEPSLQWFEVSLMLGASANTDRFSAFRLGGILPFASEFPLSIPGYFYQEISARKFALLNAQYSIPLTPNKGWRFTTFAAAAAVDYLDALEQPGDWHSGAGAGITYTSPSAAWMVTLHYSHGFNAIRDGGRGANNVGLLLQYDFEAKGRDRAEWYEPGVSPYNSRGGERLFIR